MIRKKVKHIYFKSFIDNADIINTHNYFTSYSEFFIKDKQKEFNSPRALRTRIKMRQLEMDKGIYKVVANSLFDLTNEFVPSTNKGDTGYALEPTWRIIEKNAMTWIMFMNYNFIKFIESSIERVDETHFKLQDGEKIRIIGEFRK